MFTIAETDDFILDSKKIWTEDERMAFFEYLSKNPLQGDVIPKTGGLRKIRWSAKNTGKRGGARVIYYNVLDNGYIVCVMIYAKAVKENATHVELKNLNKG